MEPLDTPSLVAALLKPLDQHDAYGPNDLADDRVVRLLVRGYVDLCLERFQDAFSGSATQDESADAIYRYAQALNAVFLGTSGLDGLSAHGWNSPDQLGVFLRDTMDFDFPPDECVRALLVHMATQIMVVLQGSRPDWQDKVDAMVDEVCDLLLGRLPDDAEAPPFA